MISINFLHSSKLASDPSDDPIPSCFRGVDWWCRVGRLPFPSCDVNFPPMWDDDPKMTQKSTDRDDRSCRGSISLKNVYPSEKSIEIHPSFLWKFSNWSMDFRKIEAGNQETSAGHGSSMANPWSRQDRNGDHRSTMWPPPVISWFISPSNYSYKYHAP